MRNFKNNGRRYRNNSFDRNFKHSSNDKSFSTSLSNISDFKKKVSAFICHKLECAIFYNFCANEVYSIQK